MATQRQKEKALERAAKAQQRYWDALSGLEKALGFVLDDASSLGELGSLTVEYLEHEYGDDGGEDEDGEDCMGGCGRPSSECASAHGADYCCDVDDYRKHGEPITWEQFEKLHFVEEDKATPSDPVERMYTEAFEGETENDRAK